MSKEGMNPTFTLCLNRICPLQAFFVFFQFLMKLCARSCESLHKAQFVSSKYVCLCANCNVCFVLVYAFAVFECICTCSSQNSEYICVCCCHFTLSRQHSAGSAIRSPPVGCIHNKRIHAACISVFVFPGLFDFCSNSGRVCKQSICRCRRNTSLRTSKKILISDTHSYQCFIDRWHRTQSRSNELVAQSRSHRRILA